VKKLEKHVPELGSEPDDDVDFAAGAADHHPVTVSEQREFEALQDEKHREHEERFRELEGEISKAVRRK
ncbi:unnamed protein product, partial [Ectocarpus sp. 12 AP-2014]